jgi:hypothetical protein
MWARGVLVTCAVVGVSVTLAPAGASARVKVQRFRASVRGTQSTTWTFHDYNPDPNCGGTADGAGSEKLRFRNSHRLRIKALQVGRQVPFLFVGRTGDFSMKGTLARQARNSFTPNPGGNGCSSGGGGPAPQPDCGTKPFSRMKMDLGYVGRRERQKPLPDPYTVERTPPRAGNLLDLTYQGSAESVDPFEDLFENCATGGPQRFLEAFNSTLSARRLMGRHRRPRRFSVHGRRHIHSAFAGTTSDTTLDWTMRFRRLKPRR